MTLEVVLKTEMIRDYGRQSWIAVMAARDPSRVIFPDFDPSSCLPPWLAFGCDSCHHDSGAGFPLHQITMKGLSGENNLSLGARCVQEMNAVVHSRGKAHVLNVEPFRIRRDGDEITLLNPGFQWSQDFL